MFQNWTEIQKYMRSKYTLERDNPQMMSMIWAYEDGRSQKVIMRKYSAFDRDMIELKSPFARLGTIDAQELLRKNAEFPLATTALSGDVYLVVYNLFVENLREEDLELAVSRVAAVADALEDQYGGGDEF